ncbi:MAG: hypothetical protein ACXWUL_09935, partial [Caldimonas sp.]
MGDRETTSPGPREPIAGARPRRRRAWRWLAFALAAAIVAAAALLAAALWAVHSASGSAWLLRQLPRVTVTAPRGALVGDFAAERIEIAFPGAGVLRLEAPRWQRLSVSRGGGDRWLHVRIAALHADRAVWLAAADRAPPGEPLRPPASLRLPIELEVAALSIGELRIGADDPSPVRGLAARVHVGADGGARHRLDDIRAERDRIRADGSIAIAADPPFAVAARAALTPTDAAAL